MRIPYQATTALRDIDSDVLNENTIESRTKPITLGYFEKVMSRIKTYPNFGAEETLSIKDRVLLQDGNTCWFPCLEELRYMETYGNYTRIYFKEQCLLIHKSLTQLESRLPSDSFFRASRQTIFNIHHVSNIIAESAEKLRVELNCGKKIPMTRRRSKIFKQEMSL